MEFDSSTLIILFFIGVLALFLATSYAMTYFAEKRNVNFAAIIEQNTRKLEKVEPIVARQEYYEKIKGLKSPREIESALVLYGKEARRIIPSFPLFTPFCVDDRIDVKQNSINFLGRLFPGISFSHKILREKDPIVLTSYSEKYMLAVEYRDSSRYNWPTPSGEKMTYQPFEELREYDQKVERLCIQNNICLIILTYECKREHVAYLTYCKLLDSVPFLDVEIFPREGN